MGRKPSALFAVAGALLPFFAAPLLFAQQEITYDPYAPAWKYPESYDSRAAEDKDRTRLMARLLEQPFRPLGYLLGETAELVQEKHMDEKVIWFFDELHSHGIYPSVQSPSEDGFLGPSGRIRIDQLLNIEQPVLKPEVSGGWSPNHQFVGSTVNLGANYMLEAPETTAFYHEGRFKYFRSSSESFYGLGQRSSLGEWNTYQPEETRLEAALGYHVSENIDSRAAFVYQHMNIGNGNRERVGKFKESFTPGAIPGFEGGNLIGLEAAVKHDTRDHEHDSRRGGYQKFKFSYFHDTDGSDLHYLTLSGSIAHFFSILSDRRVLALRLAAEKSVELGDDRIPFFNMSRLGGAKDYLQSELMRGYRVNRFYDEGLIVLNAEYRYRIYEYGNMIGEAVALADVGEVFNELGNFRWNELNVSYGAGLNLKFRRKTLISWIFARSDEGWRSAVGRSTSF